MPIYEYKCDDCGKRVNVLVLKKEEASKLHCPKCKGTRLSRQFSRFASPKSEEERMESMADPSKWRDVDENDPKSMVKFMKKMGKEFGEELGEDYDQMIEEAEEEAIKGEKSKESGDDLYSSDDLSD